MNEMNEKNIESSKNIKKLNKVILTLVIVFGAFLILALGIKVGEMKAKFSYRFAENYHRMFAGPKKGFLNGWQKFSKSDFFEAHGSFGEIIDIKGNELIIKGKDNLEKLIETKENTIIKFGWQNLKKDELKIGDFVVIIGLPTDEGKIKANFIRVFR